MLANVALWDRSAIPGALTGAEGVGSEPAGEAASTSLTGFASYLWQYVLPRVGGMQDYFNAGWTPRDLWVPIWVGRFGWSDYQFPTLLNRAALIVYAVIAVAALVVLVRFLRSRPELRAPFAIFALLGLGLVVLVARVGYPLRVSGSGVFEQGRYYMPLIPLYALALVLAAQILSERRARLRARGVPGGDGAALRRRARADGEALLHVLRLPHGHPCDALERSSSGCSSRRSW